MDAEALGADRWDGHEALGRRLLPRMSTESVAMKAISAKLSTQGL